MAGLCQLKKVDSKYPRTKGINGGLETKLVMHGAQDEWADRLSKEVGPNRGPQKDATAYSPNGGSEQLDTIADMKDYYLAHGLPWQQTWNGEY
jgi:hypothetical protein